MSAYWVRSFETMSDEIAALMPPGSPPDFGDLLDLVELGARLRGLHAGLDQLVVEVGDLLVVDGDALRHRQVVGGAIVLDRLFGRDDARSSARRSGR